MKIKMLFVVTFAISVILNFVFREIQLGIAFLTVILQPIFSIFLSFIYTKYVLLENKLQVEKLLKTSVIVYILIVVFSVFAYRFNMI